MMLLLANAVSIFGRVLTVSQVMAGLAGDLGQPVQVSKLLQPELVFVVPSTESPRMLIDEIAFAVHASVRESTDGLHVERTAADVKAIRVARATASADWIRQGIDRMSKFRESARKGVTVQQAYLSAVARQKAQVDDFYHGKRKSVDQLFPEYVLPSADLLEAIVRRIGIEKLAEIPTGQSRVYQDDPVGDDVALPPCQDLIERFTRDMAPVGVEPISSTDKKVLDGFRGNDVVAQWKNSQGVTKLRLRIYSEESDVSFWLDGFNDAGHRVLAASCGVGPKYEYTHPATAWNQFTPGELAHSVRLEEDSQSALKFLAGSGQLRLPEWFLHPERKDPLDLYVKDALTAVAAAKPGRTLIVSVQDSLWATWGQPLTKGPVSVGTLIDALRSWSQYESVSHGGAIVIRSVDPQSAEESRADRKVMGRFARALSSNGPSSLPDSAAFLYDASRRYSGLAGDWLMYGQIAVGADPPISAKSYGPQILRALGPITSSQWRRLLSGQVLTAGELGIAKCLNDLLSSWTAVDFYSQSTYPDWRKFFWELTPPGLPSDAPVALSQVSSRLVKYWDRQPEPNWGIPEKYLGEHFVWNKFHVQLENGTPSISGDRAEFEKSYSDRKFRYCELPVFQLTIGLPDGVELRETIQASMLNDDEVLQFADLKSELKDLIWKTVCDRSLAGISATRASTSPVIQPAAPPKVIPPR